MHPILKTFLAAVTGSVLTVGAAILYVDHKVDEVAETVTAPIEETVDRVSEAVSSTGESVSAVAGAAEDFISETGGEITTAVEHATERFEEAVDHTSDRATRTVDTMADAIDGFLIQASDGLSSEWESIGVRARHELARARDELESVETRARDDWDETRELAIDQYEAARHGLETYRNRLVSSVEERFTPFWIS